MSDHPERTPEDATPEDAQPADAQPAETNPAGTKPTDDAAPTTTEERIVAALRTIYDPEIPVDIYELGLIYEVTFDEDLKSAHVSMTLTSPSCPVAGTLPGEVETKVKGVDGVDDAFVELVWEPPWTMEKLSDAAKLQLGLT